MPDSSADRRNCTAERRKRKCRRRTMRRCQPCERFGVKEYVVTRESLSCVECDRTNRRCDLAPPGKEFEKEQDIIESLDEEVAAARRQAHEAHLRIIRLTKVRRFHLAKLRDMGDTEARNILEIEEDERREEGIQVSSPSQPILSDFALDPSELLNGFSDQQIADLFANPASSGTPAASSSN